ncbi:MAG TPA: threonine--tRNA ligase [Geminicoccaceae bacterium]|nr:threonine--tRNA ligase [Geminicoccaceae bacterium]
MATAPDRVADRAGGERPVGIILPDGSHRTYPGPVTAARIAADIAPGLAREAVVAEVDGELWDLGRPIDRDARVRLIRFRDEEALPVIRHDAAHLMAEAVKELYPDTQVTIGPAIEDGFYYDFARKEPFTPEDLDKIEARMREIVARDEPITCEEWRREDAVRFFNEIGERYKAEIIESIPEGQRITVYRQGGFTDLCRGPHMPSTGRMGAFKLMKVAGAYWRGDSRNAMLQRIYGTAWATEQQLRDYLHRLEEAERRDHRRLGREMDLYHFQEEAAGSAFWHPKGWTVYRAIEDYLRRRLAAAGYVEVRTPQLIDRALWEASGHWEKFRGNMFTLEAETRALALKPMNCPGHVQIFNQRLHSYRDLPLRLAEFGSCHRNEPSGALHGLMRVRAFTQDDAHIFCTPDQITAETQAFCELLLAVYRDFGFEEVRINFADRPPVRAGDDATWDRAEAALQAAVAATGLTTHLNPGEGAFYGPKLEFVLTDAIGRDWQCGTLQVDFVLPERLDASYVAEDGRKHRPVMLHRAILGSFERFIGILVEHHAGRFPLWLAPVQAVVATITNDADAYATAVAERLRAAGIRAEADLGGDKIGYKVRQHSLAKVPLIFAVGRREAEEGTVSLRRLGGREQEILALDEAVALTVGEATGPLL